MRKTSSFIAIIFCALITKAADARYYDPTVGRFISPDSAVSNANDPQNLNRYAYVRNNPMVLTDPSGHSWVSKQIHKINNWADHNPVGSILIGAIAPTIGIPLMDRTSTGRDVLAGTIIVGTSILIPGAGAVAWGALSGELVGGYSAYKARGSILSGVAVGGIVGAGSSYLAGAAGAQIQNAITNSLVEHVVGGAVQGSIVGAGSGAIAGYQGGNGNSTQIVRGLYRGAAVGAVAGGALGYLEYAARGKPIEDMSSDELMQRGRKGLETAVADGAKSNDLNSVPGSIFKEEFKQFQDPIFRSLELHPEINNAAISIGVGYEETQYNVEDYVAQHGLNGKISEKF